MTELIGPSQNNRTKQPMWNTAANGNKKGPSTITNHLEKTFFKIKIAGRNRGNIQQPCSQKHILGEVRKHCEIGLMSAETFPGPQRESL